jgi:phenylalanyl-tRNA synthetase beta chain
MKINLEWLRDFVPFTRDAAEVARDLTMAGLEVEGIEDVHGEKVFEVGVTPNRGDCLSHLGVARDLAALYRLPLSLPPAAPPEGKAKVEELAAVAVEDPEGCPRYTARVMEGVKIGPAPEKAARRLESVGVRSINNVVDATNYVMMELGQPLHAFDHALLAEGRIVVRRAGSGESFRTLDGQDRALTDGDLLICDGARPVALAGVMGGGNSEVRSDTRALLLESACFDPLTVRRTAKRLGLATEASYRFERGTDQAGTVRALDRLALLIYEWGGGKVARGLLDAHPRPFPMREIKFSLSRIADVLGVAVPEDEVAGILARLGFAVKAGKGGGLSVAVPSWRRDVSREEDLLEEIARIHGFERIPATMPVGRAVPVQVRREDQVESAARDALEGEGYLEAISYSFIDPEDLARMDLAAKPGDAVPDQGVHLKNPISREMSQLRTTLLPGLLQALRVNLNRRQKRVRLYEVGSVFFPGTTAGTSPGNSAGTAPGGAGDARACGPLREDKRVAGVFTGEREGKPWYRGREESGFPDAKGAVEAVMAALGCVRAATFKPATMPAIAPFLAEGQAAEVMVGETGAGWAGMLHPEVQKRFDLEQPVGCFEIDLDLLARYAFPRKSYVPLPRTPEVFRDLSLLVPMAHSWAEVEASTRGVAGNLAGIRLFDLYQGKGIPDGYRSLAFSLAFQDPQRTLTDEEVDREVGSILGRLQERFGARLR